MLTVAGGRWTQRREWPRRASRPRGAIPSFTWLRSLYWKPLAHPVHLIVLKRIWVKRPAFGTRKNSFQSANRCVWRDANRRVPPFEWLRSLHHPATMHCKCIVCTIASLYLLYPLYMYYTVSTSIIPSLYMSLDTHHWGPFTTLQPCIMNVFYVL